MAEQRMYGGVGIERDRRQIHVGGLPDPLTQSPLNPQYPIRHAQMQRGHKPPKRGLRRQTRYFEEPCQHRLAFQKPKMIQPRESHIQTQDDRQNEPVCGHRPRPSPKWNHLFHQAFEVKLLQHARHRQQTTVGR